MALYGCSSDLVKRGRLYEEKDDYASAIASYEKAKSREKQTASMRLAEIYIKFGEYEKAVEELESARQNLKETDETYSYVCYRLGYCHYELGNTESAIENLKKAISLNSDIAEAYLYLGTIYLKEEEYDLAVKEFKTLIEKKDNPRAHYYLAISYWGQGVQQALEAAINELRIAERAETDEAWKEKYQEVHTKIKGTLERIGGKIAELELRKSIFSCIYGFYSNYPIGTLILQNKSDEVMYNVEIAVEVKGYGRFPQKLPFQDIPPGKGKQERVDLFARFTDEILNAPFTLNQPVEVKIQYDIVGVKGEKQTRSESVEKTLLLHSKNSMVWEGPYSGMISAFVTHTDNSVEEFTRKVISTQRPFNKAIQIYNALNLYGIEYSSDASPTESNVDRVFYPRELLQLKRGDCDDLSALYAACLENVGVNTAFVLAPGHVFIMFDTEIHTKNAPDFFFGSDWYAQAKGSRHAWLPVETTFLGQSGKGFFEAWEEGIRQYKNLVTRGEIQEIVYTHDAWDNFKPVAFPDPGPLPQIPATELLQREYVDTISKINGGRESHLRKRIETCLRELEISPQNAALHNSMGIAYAKFGVNFGESDSLSKAEEHFKKALLLENWLPAPYTNLGNIFLLRSEVVDDLKKAEEKYEEAIQRGEAECVYLNKMILYIVEGNRQKAAESLAKALCFYTPEEIQTILGMSIEDFGIVKGQREMGENKIQSLIQSLLKNLGNLRLEKKIEKPEQTTVEKDKTEKPTTLKVTEIKDIMTELENILGDVVPKKPDEAISPGGVRGAMAAQLEELPLLLYWSDVRIY